jgi:hypothetical protein
MSDTASSLFITPHTKIILAAFPPDFMGLFIPPSHYIPNRKKINKNKNKSNLWQPWLLTDRDEMCNLVRGSSIDASYQDLVPLGKRFQRRSSIKIAHFVLIH